MFDFDFIDRNQANAKRWYWIREISHLKSKRINRLKCCRCRRRFNVQKKNERNTERHKSYLLDLFEPLTPLW